MTILNPDLTGFGQKWNRGTNRSANDLFSGCSLYMDDFTVVTFMRRGTGAAQLVYNRSDDGGKTLVPTQYQAGGLTVNDLLAVRVGTLASGAPYYVILENTSSIVRSEDFSLLLHPFDSTWTRTVLGGPTQPVSPAQGLGVRGLNVVVAGSAGGGGNLAFWWSIDGGVTLTQFVPGTGTVTQLSGTQNIVSPEEGVWCYLNNQSGNVWRSTNFGATWAVVANIPQGSASGLLSQSAAIIYLEAEDRMIAVRRGQIAVSLNRGLTWVNKQNLTNPAFSPTDIRQADICGFLDFNNLRGTHFLGAFSIYVAQIVAGTTVKSAWRSVDLGENWTLVDVVGGLADTVQPLMTGAAARNGRGVVNIYNNGDFNQRFWYNESAGPGIGELEVAGLGECSSFGVCPCV